MDTTESSDKGVEAPEVVDRYKGAAEIANSVLGDLEKFAYAGMSILTLCRVGDAQITKKAGAVFNKARTESGEKLEKGVSFPTCVSKNHCAAHFSPITEEEGGTLAEGDVITMHLGAHIDGYCAMAARTITVRAEKEAKEPVIVDGRAADAMVAAWVAAQALLRVMRPGRTNNEVTDVIEKVAKDFEVTPVEGVLSHIMKRYVIDGSKVAMNRRDVENGTRVDEWEFEENEVYAMDIVMSTGEGKTLERNAKPTVYKRRVESNYQLKLKASRTVCSEIDKKFPTMPFTIRAIGDDPKRSRLGMTEMVTHEMVTSYPVLFEKEGEYVARVCMTVLVLPQHTLPITAIPEPYAKSSHEVSDQSIKDLLAISIERKKKKKSKSKAQPDATEAMET